MVIAWDRFTKAALVGLLNSCRLLIFVYVFKVTITIPPPIALAACFKGLLCLFLEDQPSLIRERGSIEAPVLSSPFAGQGAWLSGELA